MMSVGIIGAFVAGLISFISPCVLPLVPPYLCYLAGSSLDELQAIEDETTTDIRNHVVIASLAFVAGFVTVFVALGATASVIGGFVADNSQTLSVIAGVLISLFGLHFLGVFKIPLLYRELRFYHDARPAGLIGSYAMGLAFAFGWTPCVGPVLASILFVAAGSDSVGQGMMLLTAYGLGIGLPFVMAAFAVRPFLRWSRNFRAKLATVEKIMGGMLLVTGILFVSGSFNTMGFWLLEAFPALGRFG